MQKRRFTPSPALVVSLIALFVALGGTSYAAISAALPRNSVGTKQIKNGAVTAKKINRSAAGAVKTVGTPPAPPYLNSWIAADSAPDDEGVSFYKDSFGIVHIQGNAYNTVGAVTSTIFTLPAGYRPAGEIYFSVYGDSATEAYIQVSNSGAVSTFDLPQDWVGLSNISFRAGA